MSDFAWKLMTMINDLDQYQDLSRGLVGGNPTWHLLLHFLLRFMSWKIFYISISIHLIMITRHIWKTRRRGSLLLSSWSASSCWPAALPSAPPPAASCRTRWGTPRSRSTDPQGRGRQLAGRICNLKLILRRRLAGVGHILLARKHP